ncbi:MAG: amylo-alpha-1,6-glucosidase [Candidatus Heimdallarchaeota archaeon]
MKNQKKKLIISNGLLWAYLKENSVDLFYLGNWLGSYEANEYYSLENSSEITDQGNKVHISYPDKSSREIILQKNILIDTLANVVFAPTFSNSLLYRGDEHLEPITRPITTTENNEYLREGYPKIKTSISNNQFKLEVLLDETFLWDLDVPDYVYWLSQHLKADFTNENMSNLYSTTLRSLYKLRMMTPDGEIKAAGFPDFPSLFGRDFAISALGEVYLNPMKIKEEIAVHLKHIGTKKDIIRGMQKGRAVHEYNYDVETMAGKYHHFPSWYANDSNALLLMTIFRLARLQFDFTIINDHPKTIKSLWNHIAKLDSEDDGLLRYKQEPGQLLIHQTWRDGGDEITHPNDLPVDHPIAPLHDQLCFIGAMKEILWYTEYNGSSPIGLSIEKLKEKIDATENLVQNKYWMPKLDSYALAIDKFNEQVKVVNSDVCLGYYYNIFPEESAVKQYRAIIDPDRLYDLVGIRTISKEHPSYSPRKYQRGAVWPWQLSLTIAGLRNYNLDMNPLVDCLEVLTRDKSIAEVYIADEEQPTPLTSCVEQRWSSAIPWLALLEGILGLKINYTDEPTWDPVDNYEKFGIEKIADMYINGLKTTKSFTE